MTTLPTRAAIDKAAPLDFPERRPSEKDVSICIEAGPAGVTVRVDYIGTLGSIPAAIERLRAAGVLELVIAAKVAPGPSGGNTPARKPAQKPIAPWYNDRGETCCTVHRRPLSLGQYGMYCSAKAKIGEEQNDKGFCSIRFAD